MTQIREPNQAASSRSKTSTIVLLILAWGLPIAWIASSAPFHPPKRPRTVSELHIRSLHKSIQDFHSELGQSPRKLSDLRAFLWRKDIRANFYDGYGQRIEYVRLDEQHYALRSFGKDGRQSTMTSSPDPAIVKWGRRAKNGLTFRYTEPSVFGFYPPALLLGADSPNATWRARVFLDKDSGERRLVARHRSKKDRFMIAPHEGVEEFVWLPSGYQIVFTASATGNHSDGIFLWNLMTGQIDDLSQLIEIKKIPAALRSRVGIWSSIASVGVRAANVAQKDASQVILFVAPRNAEGRLDPRRFFARGSLAGFVIPETGDPQLMDLAGLEIQREPFGARTRLGRQIQQAQVGLKAQRKWLSLPLEGGVRKALHQWQQFSEREIYSPVFSYCLWYLSAIYSHAFQLNRDTRPQDAEILRSLGAEIAQALTQHTGAPAYLVALARAHYDDLIGGHPLPYRFDGLIQKPLPPVPAQAVPQARPAKVGPKKGGE